MANSLELRVPFLDRKVFELASHIPTKCKDVYKRQVVWEHAARIIISHGAHCVNSKVQFF